MEYRHLGHSGVRVSVIGLGTNRFGNEKVSQEAVNRMIDTALDLGINFIDTADTYVGGRSEETLGVALKGRWDKVILATKFTHPTGPGVNERGASRYHMIQAVEASLRRLQRDAIDLYYMHTYDANTPLEETLRGLDDLISAGKVRYVGASNFAAWRLSYANLLAEVRGWTAFIVLQSHYHMLERSVEHEILDCCWERQVGLIPYFPLAGGFLTGKYQRGQPAPPGSRGETSTYVQQYMTEANYDHLEKLTAWAGERGHTLTELAHAWLLAHPQVSSVISGATRAEQVESNARAAGWVLSAEDMGQIGDMLR